MYIITKPLFNHQFPRAYHLQFAQFIWNAKYFESIFDAEILLKDTNTHLYKIEAIVLFVW